MKLNDKQQAIVNAFRDLEHLGFINAHRLQLVEILGKAPHPNTLDKLAKDGYLQKNPDVYSFKIA